MLYDKPSRWAYTFQVKAPEYIEYIVILRWPTCLPVLLFARVTPVSAEFVHSFSAHRVNSRMLKIPFSSTSVPFTQTGNDTHLSWPKHTLGFRGLRSSRVSSPLFIGTCLHPICMNMATWQKQSGMFIRTGTAGSSRSMNLILLSMASFTCVLSHRYCLYCY